MIQLAPTALDRGYVQKLWEVVRHYCAVSVCDKKLVSFRWTLVEKHLQRVSMARLRQLTLCNHVRLKQKLKSCNR